MALFDTIRAGASGAASAYEVERSIRLNRNDSSYFEIARSSDGNRKKWTFSTWLKVANHGNDLRGVIAYNGTGNNRENLAFDANGKLAYQLRVSGSNKAQVSTTAVFRDPSAWYHLVFIWDSDNSTSTDRAIFYINGVRQEVTIDNTPASGAETYINSTTTHYINNDAHWGASDISYAETYFIDGQAYDATYFAKTDTITGQWNPKKYTSGFSGNSFYCNYSDNSGNTSTTIGKDSSGLGNNITPFNVSVSAGTGNDSVEDTPTNNFPTWHPLYTSTQTGGSTSYSQGNLKLNTTSGGSGNLYPFGFTTFGARSGKWYAEFKCDTNNVAVGVANTGQLDSDVSSNPYGAYANTSIIYTSRGEVRSDNAYVSQSEATYSNGDVIGVALDLDNNKIYFHKNGSYIGSGNPSAGSNGYTLGSLPSGKSGSFVFSCGSDGAENVGVFANLGQRAFDYTQPTGYKKLNSANLPDPTIALPTDHFDTLLYTGNTGSQNITGLDFDPDWVWAKSRSTTGYHHELYDTLRGDNLRIFSSQNNNELTGYLQFGQTGGFSLTAGGGINISGQNLVAWCWNAGGSTVTNNNGTISTQVRANTTAGFSVVTYTGNGSTSATIGHGLGVKPDLIYIKNRSSSVDWVVMHSSNPSYDGGNYKHQPLKLNTNDALVSILGIFSTPNSSTQSISDGQTSSGNRPLTNTSGSNYVAYFFSSVAGYSKAGSYTGNGSTDGTFEFTGFRPAYIILKRTNSAAAWIVHDNKRSGSNPDNDYLQPDDATADSDGSGGTLDILSNGFKLRSTPGTHNGSGDTYIYFAIAESSFKYARAR